MESIEALTIEEENIKLNQENLEGLKAQIRGTIITPGSESYDEARSIYNAMIDKKPGHYFCKYTHHQFLKPQGLLS